MAAHPPAVRAIAAVSRNGIIGIGGRLPWRLPREWQHFKEQTRGGTLLLGRVCHAENGQLGLAGRATVVITRSGGASTSVFHSDCPLAPVRAAQSLPAAVALARQTWPTRPIWICGGERIYEQALLGSGAGPASCTAAAGACPGPALCEELVLTRVGAWKRASPCACPFF